MFARRRRRPEDDEPLVPHGMVWQATDETETAPDHAETPVPIAAVTIKEPLEMPLRQPALQEEAIGPSKSAAADTAQADVPPAKLGAISPPIPWPSPSTTSVIKRTPAGADGQWPGSKASSMQTPRQPAREESQTIKSPTPAPDKASAAVPTEISQQLLEKLSKQAANTPIRKLEVIDIAAADDGPRAEAFARLKENLRQHSGLVYARAVTFLGASRRVVQVAWRTIRIRERMNQIAPIARACVDTSRNATRSAEVTVRLWARNNSPRLFRARASLVTFTSGALKFSAARSMKIAQSAGAYKVRVRMAQAPRLQSLIRRGKKAMAGWRPHTPEDARLWTSIGMAAISALLTIALISAVTHYAPGADASAKTGPQVQKTSSAPAPATESEAADEAAVSPVAGPARTAHRRAAVTLAKQKPRPALRRVRHVDGEDYVAPDTYHYYGTSGKPR